MNPFNIWIFLLIPPLLLNADPTQGEVHSLNYIYIAFSKPVDLPGIHEFIAMAQLDGRTIEYYDSVNQKLVPKQPWIKESLPSEYWVEGTQARQYKQQWFKVNMNILMKRLGQNATDTHILQWEQGCEGDIRPDGTLQFIQGWDRSNYDGNDLFYDYVNRLWINKTEAAKEWEGPILKEYYQGQQDRCIEWLSKFMTYAVKQLKSAPPPEVFVFAKNAKVSANVVLVCLATGFFPKDITLQIRKDGRLLDMSDGVISSGVRPNGNDGTYQGRDEVEIVRADDSQFTCEVNHKAFKVHVQMVWEQKLHVHPNSDFPIGAVVGGVVAIVVLTVAVVIGVLYQMGIIGGSKKGSKESFGRQTSNDSNVSKGSDGSGSIPQSSLINNPNPVRRKEGSPSGSDSGLSTTNNSCSSIPEAVHLMVEEAWSPSENYQDSLSSLPPT